MNALSAARTVFGAWLLIAPATVVEERDGTDKAFRIVARILGTRHLLQAVFAGARGPALQRAGVAVDAIHCATALALALVDPRRRELALKNAGTAALLAAAGAVEAQRSGA